MRFGPLLFVCTTILLAGATSALAVQTAYWQPYQADPYTYGLFHFDAEPPTVAEGKCAPGEVLGDATFEREGRFGGALRLGGHGAVRFTPREVLPGQRLCIEAWVKLDRYPEKEACLVFRPATVDASAQYDPKVDRAQGFQLTVDSKGALHHQVTNVFYGYTIRTSSPEGAVPLNTWVHVAGVSGGLGSYRRVYANGHELTAVAVEWGQALWGDEVEATPIYVGNNAEGTAGVAGVIDEVRLHTAIFKLWPPEDLTWTDVSGARSIPTDAPHFLPGHQPTLYLPLDGSLQPAGTRIAELKVDAKEPVFAAGVRGQSCRGALTLAAPKLVDLHEGSLECWLQPVGVDNYTDFCRGFLTMDPANLYIYNTGVITGTVLPLSLYFYRDGKPVFVVDRLGTELHEGAWYHVVLTWQEGELTLYVNGVEAGKNVGPSMVMGDAAVGRRLAFEPSAQVDEVYLYDQALTRDEAANCYFRYRDPKQLRPVKLLAVKIQGGHLPSLNRLYYRLIPQVPREQIARVALTLADEKGQVLLTEQAALDGAEHTLKAPDLPDGTYTLTPTVTDAGGKTLPGEAFMFERKHFAWERNALGVTDRVYPPFQPITVAGQRVSVVQREYEMNGFGLWNQVRSQGRDLLAGPMRVRFETAAGEGRWTNAQGAFTGKAPNVAVYAAEAAAPPVRLKATSALEMDGCMKVTLDLLPSPRPEEVRRLWLDIPVKAKEAALFHVVTDGLRSNYSGKAPEGTGAVWDGSRATRYNTWQNCFVTYLWLGAEERGLAWFAENDRGWITEKGGSKRTIQELVREGDSLTLRVYLVNVPTTITKPTRLVFGLQASPTKPLPADWRLKLADIPGGLPVVPWGGLHCAYQTPYHDDWSIVDKIVEARTTKNVDRAWFEAYTKQHDPPAAFGNWPWLSSVCWFANRCATVGPDKPVSVYQEEMAASVVRSEWRVFQDEWRPESAAGDRSCPDESIFRQGRETSPSGGTTFVESYRDFGVHVANEWLKRGVSLYWDNTFPHVSWNPRTTDAYVTENGQVQPCVIIWNQREYQKRVWNLLQYWRTQRREPLEWILHMTNTLLLPVHTWGTANLDHELAVDKPFTPEWLRTETMGRQIGNYGLSLYEVYGRNNAVVQKLPEPARNRIEWGMRAVHEIQHGGELDRLLTDFGYGTDRAAVVNYWSEEPPLAVSNDRVKWLALSRKADRALLIVLASWSEGDEEAQVTIDPQRLGSDLAGKSLVEAESGEALAADAKGVVTVKLPGPYGVRLLRTKE